MLMAEEGQLDSSSSSPVIITEDDEEATRRQCDALLDRIGAMIDREKIGAFVTCQEDMLKTLEETNERLASLNHLSEIKYQGAVMEFRQNTRTLLNMKKELDSIFRRIRSLKVRLAAEYPQHYSVAESHCHGNEDM